MQVRKLRMNGIDVLVEAKEIYGAPPMADFSGRAADGSSIDVGDQVNDLLRAVATSAQRALFSAAPDEWSFELDVGFHAENGLPYLARGDLAGCIRFAVKWKKPGT